MRLHDLQVGHRFTFTDKHRGKVFEIAARENKWVLYVDVATQERRIAKANRKTFLMSVELVTENRVVELTPHEVEMLQWILYGAYVDAETERGRSEINALHIKLTGSAGRRVVLPNNEEI